VKETKKIVDKRNMHQNQKYIKKENNETYKRLTKRKE
jgi:hypothetical protein